MSLSSRELVDQARREVGEVAARDLEARLQGSGRLLDVREPDEVLQGVIPDAVDGEDAVIYWRSLASESP